jgi:NADPH:quinone reductase-like Zn-dependent oxidoreductase
MKAVRVQNYGGPEQLRYEDAPAPEAGEGQVLVRVRATSVNPWDLKLASGAHQKHIPLVLPYVPGSDFSGVVEVVGAGVNSGVKVGDEVYGNCPVGGAAELVAAPGGTLAAKPRGLSHAEAVAAPVAASTAYQALFDHGRLEAGQTVLIHAASGGVGTFAVQLARWRTARVLATASAANAEYVRGLGADVVIDYKATPFESVARDVDLVLDLLGGETQTRSYATLKRGGRLISTVQPTDADFARQYGVEARMMGMEPSTALLTELARLLDAGTIQATVTETFPLAKAFEAWRWVQSGHTRGKVVMEVG